MWLLCTCRMCVGKNSTALSGILNLGLEISEIKGRDHTPS